MEKKFVINQISRPEKRLGASRVRRIHGLKKVSLSTCSPWGKKRKRLTGAKAKGRAYDAIVLDLAMPEMDGIETLKHLLKINPDLQIILLTVHATLQKGIEATKLGAMGFLEKPAEIKDLMEKIQQAKANKMLLVEKQMEKKIKGILEHKSW